jgi:hypothetical protein
MGRILYIVAREHPLLCGYLMAKVDARSPDGHSVEIKLDERKTERRRQSEGRALERRRSEQRRQPSLDPELRSRGYATVVQHEDTQGRAAGLVAGRALGWRPRSTRGQRTARAWRRNGVRWALRAAVLLAAVGLSIVVARSIYPTANPSGSMPGSVTGSKTGQPAPRVQEKSALPATLPTGPVSQANRPTPTPPSPPTPVRVIPARVSGVVLSVDEKARTLVLEDRGAAPELQRLRVGLAPDTRIALSERDSQLVDFKDTAITLSEVRSGDFVVVDLKRSEGTPLARSIVVTFRANRGAGGPTRPAN